MVIKNQTRGEDFFFFFFLALMFPILSEIVRKCVSTCPQLTANYAN